MIATRRQQRKFADGFIAEAVEDLWEPWMRHADTASEDDTLLLLIQQELAKRCKKSKTRGRRTTPAEVVLRFAELIGLVRLAFADYLGARLKDAEQLSLGLGVAAKHPLACLA